MKIPQPNDKIPFDIIACDRNSKTVLLVDVRTKHLLDSNDRDFFISKVKLYLQEATANIPFVMLVSLSEIDIFRASQVDFSEPISYLETAEVLSTYEPDYGQKRIFSYYLEGLVEAWLRDLAYHWKSDKPPASEELIEIGLLQQIEGGTTYSGAALRSESLY